MHRLIAALRRFDDHWLGDLIGAASLFAFVPVFLILTEFLR
ncbi:hypothetical protein RNZ50_15920 [Paracoccaceae bacterium Fryx2]|nr:hypothetical protein [Paracoccaceae bacterium Fryx2]MDT8856482.1 hypothetical protein [Paracoccaceae bacterium Fryx2]